MALKPTYGLMHVTICCSWTDEEPAWTTTEQPQLFYVFTSRFSSFNSLFNCSLCPTIPQLFSCLHSCEFNTQVGTYSTNRFLMLEFLKWRKTIKVRKHTVVGGSGEVQWKIHLIKKSFVASYSMVFSRPFMKWNATIILFLVGASWSETRPIIVAFLFFSIHTNWPK